LLLPLGFFFVRFGRQRNCQFLHIRRVLCVNLALGPPQLDSQDDVGIKLARVVAD
jgi:hypothetical protein